MAPLVYLLCGLASLLCTALLVRAHSRSPLPLLRWSAFCFAGLTAANWLLFIDLVLFPTSIDLSLLRGVVTLLALAALIYGLLQRSRR
jgi:hypothetical protein